MAMNFVERTLGGVLGFFFHAKDEDLLINKVDLPDTIEVTSDEVKEGEPMARSCGQDNENTCPSLHFANVPEATKSLIVVMQDADPPMPFPITHMIRTNLKDHSFALGELDTKGKKGKAFMGKTDYIGPKPIIDHGPHRYMFEVYALSTDEDAEGANLAKVEELIKRYGIAKGNLTGTYERKS